ncbi:MAG: universal stress protein [Cyanobacteria bacterium J06621_8]
MSLFSQDRVLVPIDFSEGASLILQETLKFVAKPTNLYVVHALPPLSPLEPGIVWNEINNETRKQKVEQTFRTKFNTPEYEQVNFTVLFGKTSQLIVKYAQEQNIELIVMPAHGHDDDYPMLLGSVTERVVRCAHCPVYVWRSP